MPDNNPIGSNGKLFSRVRFTVMEDDPGIFQCAFVDPGGDSEVLFTTPTRLDTGEAIIHHCKLDLSPLNKGHFGTGCFTI